MMNCVNCELWKIKIKNILILRLKSKDQIVMTLRLKTKNWLKIWDQRLKTKDHKDWRR